MNSDIWAFFENLSNSNLSEIW
jgi:hypothetical protein